MTKIDRRIELEWVSGQRFEAKSDNGLEKMRSGFTGLRISIEGERVEEPPRYFHRVRMHFEIQGDVPRDKAQRAVDLSFEKYCSVFHSLRKDLVVDTTIDIQEAT